MKTLYELLGVEPSADTDTIKKAFRLEIARYHPDKVQHLGKEFQEMAATRAAELTAAYKLLTDPGNRAEYDRSISAGSTPAGVAPEPTAPQGTSPDPLEQSPVAPPPAEPSAARRYEQDRAGRDEIMRRATLDRVRSALANVLGDCHMPVVRGFDLACIPKSKPVTSMTISQFFKRTVLPAVLVRIVPIVDGALATESWTLALRLRLENKTQPIALLLIGHELAPGGELAKAIEEARRKSPASQDVIFPVPISLRDFSAKIPLNAPETIRTLVERLKSSV